MTHQKTIDDLTITVKQLATALRHAAPGSILPNKAFDTLRRHNILPKIQERPKR